MPWLDRLLRDDAPPARDFHAGAFEGLYGFVYDRAIQQDALRRLAGVAYGDMGPVVDLDGFCRRVAAGTVARNGGPPVLLDVPTGGGTLLPRLAKAGYGGRVIASDLGGAMLDRARRRSAGLDVAYLQADAQDLPLADASVDAAVSLNGLHCIPDPWRFVAELGRVVRPGGRLFLITLVSRGDVRADVVIGVGRLAGIIPGPLPRYDQLVEDLGQAGFGDIRSLGGRGITGLAATRS